MEFEHFSASDTQSDAGKRQPATAANQPCNPSETTDALQGNRLLNYGVLLGQLYCIKCIFKFRQFQWLPWEVTPIVYRGAPVYDLVNLGNEHTALKIGNVSTTLKVVCEQSTIIFIILLSLLFYHLPTPVMPTSQAQHCLTSIPMN